MKKLSKKIKFIDFNENKFVNVIDGLIGYNLGGDWSEYKDGEKVRYSYDFNDNEDYLEILSDGEVELDELKKFVDKGICYVIDKDIWYNVTFKDDVMLVDYVFVSEDEYDEED